jgi:hypothetical protein
MSYTAHGMLQALASLHMQTTFGEPQATRVSGSNKALSAIAFVTHLNVGSTSMLSHFFLLI